MGRSPCCSKEGLNRGAWTANEDKILREFIRVHGEGRWRNLPKRAGLRRCGKSCRLRWLNYLRPDIKRGNISSDEEELIIRLHKLLGNRWSLIAGRLPGRTDNEIKNYWNTNLGKKVKDGHKSTTYENITQNPMPHLPNPSPSQSLPKLDSHLVRTKATKCSKLVFPHPSMVQLPNDSKTHAEEEEEEEAEEDAEEETEAEAARVVDSMISSDQMEPTTTSNGFLSEEKEHSTDILIDFNVGDIYLSDLLSSDFSNTYNFNCTTNTTCSDQPDPLFSDEILRDWMQTNFADETNASNNLHSFTSLLETSEED